MTNKGLTVVEVIFAVVISTVVGFAIIVFVKDVIRLNYSAQASMTAMLEGRKILGVMVSELRSTIPSALGAYPIESASTSTIVFFADVNSDDVADRVRYFLDQETMSIRRGVVLAEGDPPAYNLGTESLSFLVTSVFNGTSTPFLEYYDGNYNGGTSALSLPINIPAVRLIKVSVRVEKDPNRAPEMTTITSEAALRNLKDNL